jgi:amino acid permease
MFYEMVHEMVFEMAFVAFAIWVAMMALEKRQNVFRWAVISGVLLFWIASYLGMQQLAIAVQLASLCLLLLGWICKVHWKIKHGQSEMDS